MEFSATSSVLKNSTPHAPRVSTTHLILNKEKQKILLQIVNSNHYRTSESLVSTIRSKEDVWADGL
jgi:hypothetical protein